MKLWPIALLLCNLITPNVYAWGQEGHSIVAEIAQRQLNASTQKEIAKILGNGVSLASIASWADDVREARPHTYNWHFVDIPINENAYNANTHCKAHVKGDCIVAELNRLKNEMRCAPSNLEKADALRFAVHFVGDIHQPLHTVDEAKGGNQIQVATYIRGTTCTGICKPTPTATNLHTVWDSTIIQKASWNWGTLVNQIESSLTASVPASISSDPKDWAEETHRIAQHIWASTPSNSVIDEQYYLDALPIVKKQLGLAGIRLAQLLNDSFDNNKCSH